MSQPNSKVDLPLADCFSETPKKVKMFTHLWTIENFSFHPKDKVIKSPRFSAAPDDEVQWQVSLHPDGNVEDSKGFISLFLSMISREARESCVRFEFSILNENHESRVTSQYRKIHKFDRESVLGCKRFMERKEVTDTKFPGDTLIVRTEIGYAAEVSPTAPSLSSFFPPGMPEHNPSTDFREMLETGMFFDVVFDVNGREFRAHKVILATRSPTFKNLFEQNSESTTPTRLKIRDADDHTFSELLYLIYTGKTKESYPRIRTVLSAIAARGQATPEVDSSDEEEEEETEEPEETQSRETNGTKSSELKDTTSAHNSIASALSVLESIKALNASIDTLRLDSSTDEANSEDDSTKTSCKIHPEIRLALSAILAAVASLISATTLHSQREKPPREESIETTEIADGTLSKKQDPILPTDSTEDPEDTQLRGSSIEVAERDLPRKPIVVPIGNKFNGDKTTFFEWWRGFKAQVHERRDLCTLQKLINLLSFLEGEAKECINSSALEVTSYYSTLDSLFLRYGNIGALPPGMFALLILRRRSSLTLPLRIVDNRELMEQIENIHRVPDALKSVKPDEVEHIGKQENSGWNTIPAKGHGTAGVFPLSGSRCQCQASNVNGTSTDAPTQQGKFRSFVFSIEQQLEGLESLFAKTRWPDILALISLAKKIGLTEATIKMWFELRPVDWNDALHPHWQLGQVDALRGCLIQTETFVRDSDLMETHWWPSSSSASSASSASWSDIL